MSVLSVLAPARSFRKLRSSPRRTVFLIGVVVGAAAVGIILAAWFHLGPFVVTGISDGAIYALAALGLVLTYKTSGIFNFAIGAQAAASAYVFYSLRVKQGLPWPVAAALSIIGVGLVGSLVLERIASWLSEAAPAMKVVAIIGILVLLQSVLTGVYGSSVIEFPAFLPSKGVDVFGVHVLGSQIIAIAVAVVSTTGLYLFFKRARVGVAMQAVVESPTLLTLEGTNPVVVRRYAWAIGSCFISVSGILLAPTLGIDVNLMLLIYIAAFGAAALGSFSSLPITFLASMGIGIAMSVVSDELGGKTNFVVADLYNQIPFLVLVAALLLIPKKRLIERGAGVVRRLRPPVTFSAPVLAGGVGAAAVLAVTIPFVVGAADVNQYTTGLGYAVVLASLSLLLWTSGQISLCQMAFAAVGATTFAHALQAGFPWLLAVLVAGAVAIPVGAVAAIPSFRISGIYLAVATFGYGLLLQNLVFTSSLMFGSTNTQTVARPHLFGLNTTSDRGYYYVALAIAALCALLVIGVRRSRLGRLLRGLSDSPTALEAHGTNSRVTRLYVFCLAAFLAAIGGVLIAGVTQSAGGDITGPFSYFNSLALVAVLAVCGRQALLSPAIAAFVFVVLRIYRPFSEPFFTKYQGVFFGLLAIGVAVVPGIRASLASRRSIEREGRGPVQGRVEVARPVQSRVEMARPVVSA